MSDSSSLVPQHLGLILDGNRRWARERGLALMEGHKVGYENLKTIARAAFDQGVSYVSAYVFSTENWNRSKAEVSYLMRLLMWVLKHEVEVMHRDGIRLRVIGSKLRLGAAMVKAIHEAEKKTEHNQHGTLLLCLNYGGQQEIVEATKRVVAAGYTPEQITPDLLNQFLYAPDVPPVDLLIRTSGEQRLSNFMLWESAYSELLFTKLNWPAFSPADLRAALDEYANRQRRFGK
ncbi:MAG TPA: polyprenyl diphosphate synthase [Candidatus Saccharimonadales bacterium]|nr:polyprenyl diphosphate synthase [Candidatus Saccharimonadales bacterium]